MTRLPPIARRSVIALAVTLVVVVAACGPEPTSPTREPVAFDGRLLVHTGRPEEVQLFAVDGRGRETALATPEGGLRWFAAAADGRLAGVGPDGSISVADASAKRWGEMSTEEVPAGVTGDIRLPAWSTDGRLAIVYGDSVTAAVLGVLVLDPATGGGLWVDLDAGLGGYPPAWLDAGRLAIPTRDATDRPTIVVLAVDSAAVEATVTGGRALAASPDGSTVAVLRADGRTVDLLRPADWLGGAAEPLLGRIQVAEASSIDALALDRTGDRLAVGIVTTDDGVPGVVRVHDGTDGWAVALERPMAAGAPIGALAFVR